MPVADINAKLQSLATASNGADLNRNAVFFMPGTYGSAAEPNDPATATGYIDSSVGFMESVQGLGTSPGDVRINGNLRSGGPGQRALGYFWRSLTNMQDQPDPGGHAGAHACAGRRRRPRRCGGSTWPATSTSAAPSRSGR